MGCATVAMGGKLRFELVPLASLGVEVLSSTGTGIAFV